LQVSLLLAALLAAIAILGVVSHNEQPSTATNSGGEG
jgi:hypothetical protein